MREMRFVNKSAFSTLLCSALLFASSSFAADDPLVGKYLLLRSLAVDNKTPAASACLEKDGSTYRLTGVKPYEIYRFEKSDESVLVDKKYSIGKIRIGELQFLDKKGVKIPVLKCEFCYDHFYLIKTE